MPKRNNRYNKEDLASVIKDVFCWTDVCRAVGVKPLTGAQSHLKRVAIKFGIDFSHFLGRGVTRGRKSCNKPKPIELYLSNTLPLSSAKLRIRLIKEGYKEPKCEKCGITEWLGEPIDLELDHLDSNHFNNALVNLQVVCSNCHTFVTKSRKKVLTQKLHVSILFELGNKPS